jgi:hypothetical protein
MKPVRTVSRRSFLAIVAGAPALGLAACTTGSRSEETEWDPLENGAPRDRGRVRPGSEAPPTRCSDGDSGPNADQHNRGRRCRPR